MTLQPLQKSGVTAFSEWHEHVLRQNEQERSGGCVWREGHQTELFPTAGQWKPHSSPWPEMKTPKHSASKPQPSQFFTQTVCGDHCMLAVHSVIPFTGRLSVEERVFSDQVTFPWSGYHNRLIVSIDAQIASGSTCTIYKIGVTKEMCRPSLQMCLKKETA